MSSSDLNVQDILQQLHFGIIFEEFQAKNIHLGTDHVEKSEMLGNFVNRKNAELNKAISETTASSDYDENNRADRDELPVYQQYGLLSKFDKAKQFLQEHLSLISEDTLKLLSLWCRDQDVRANYMSVENISRQAVIMKFILKLIQNTKKYPHECLETFFNSLAENKKYEEEFFKELEEFRESVRENTKELEKRIDEEDEQASVDNDDGLDPNEVINSLPKEMQICLLAQDLAQLQEVVLKIPHQEAVKHLKACLESGLLVKQETSAGDETMEKTTDDKISEKKI